MTIRSHSREQVFAVAMLAAAAALGFACGGSSRKVAYPAAGTSTSTAVGGGAIADPQLTRDDASGEISSGICEAVDSCPAANMDVASPGFTATGLRGFVGEPVPWKLTGVDINTRERRVGVLLNNIPADAKLIPADTVEQTARIEWTPDQKKKNGKKLEIYLRDLERCELTEADPSTCKAYKKMEAYDKKVTVDWEIVSRDDADGQEGGGASTGSSTSTDTDPSSIDVPPPSPSPSSSCPSSAGGPAGGFTSILSGLGGGIGGLGNIGTLLGSFGGGGAGPSGGGCP